MNEEAVYTGIVDGELPSVVKRLMCLIACEKASCSSLIQGVLDYLLT